MEEFSRELPNLGGAAVRALPSDLTEREEIDLLCQVETYMSVTDKHSQTHPAAGAQEARIYSLVNGLIAKRFSDIGAAVRGEAVAERSPLYWAAINCAHMIDADAVTLYADPELPGNALSQLGDRLDAAAVSLSARAADAPSEPSEAVAEFKIVPVEPTGVMKDAGANNMPYQSASPANAAAVYRAMLAVAPVAKVSARAADALDSQPNESQIAELESQLAECVALSQKWASAAGEADGRTEKMRAAFHINMLRAFPERSHEEIAAEIDRAASSPPTDGGVRND